MYYKIFVVDRLPKYIISELVGDCKLGFGWRVIRGRSLSDVFEDVF